MDSSWRWRSMASKGPTRVSGSELAFAISSAEDPKALGEGLRLLNGAWGSHSLAEMLCAPASSTAPSGPWSKSGPWSSVARALTVLGQVAQTCRHVGPEGAHPGWWKIEALLDWGANPESAPQGCQSAISQMCAKVEGSMDPRSCPEREAVEMMLAKCDSAGDGEWVASLAEQYPASAELCAREWARRQRSEIEQLAANPSVAKEWAPRL